jgi:hypothetical protein
LPVGPVVQSTAINDLFAEGYPLLAERAVECPGGLRVERDGVYPLTVVGVQLGDFRLSLGGKVWKFACARNMYMGFIICRSS